VRLITNETGKDNMPKRLTNTDTSEEFASTRVSCVIDDLLYQVTYNLNRYCIINFALRICTGYTEVIDCSIQTKLGYLSTGGR